MAVITSGPRQGGPQMLGPERSIGQCLGRPPISTQEPRWWRGGKREKKRAERSRQIVAASEQSHRQWGGLEVRLRGQRTDSQTAEAEASEEGGDVG